MKYHIICLLSIISISRCIAQDILPPFVQWHGESEKLMHKGNDPLITPFEQSGGTGSATLPEMLEWFAGLQNASKNVQLGSIGTSAEGRDILMVKVSSDDIFMYGEPRNSDRPTVLVQAGIHSGEIDGKDAGMMLLRDIAVGGKTFLLNKVNIIFIPILNIDGHERNSAYGRINQRGPEIIGWRSNARNLNLNRDYSKLETEEILGITNIINLYNPVLYIDIHVTDGVDYQYDITYGPNGKPGYSPSCNDWMETFYEPFVKDALIAAGHIPGPLIFAMNDRDMEAGIANFFSGPRFSTGYGDLRHVPTILVENHSLKPFKQRVLGTYVFLEASLRIIIETYKEVKDAMVEDKNRRPEMVPIQWKLNEMMRDSISFKGIKSIKKKSEITGAEYVEWTGEPVTQRLAAYNKNDATLSVKRPVAYIIPASRKEIISKLKAHGVIMSELTVAETLDVEMYRIKDIKPESQLPFQGRMRMHGTPIMEKRKEIFPKGSMRISTDQPSGDLLIVLLEPDSPDSFFRWGFFPEISERTEYFEVYVMEKLAAKMLAESPELKLEFDSKKKSDADFAANQNAQLRWFYEKTPYADQHYLLYPVGIIRN